MPAKFVDSSALLGGADSRSKCDIGVFKNDLPIGIFPSSWQTEGGPMTYRQVTAEDRQFIWRLKQENFPIAQIGKLSGRHRSTIYRELKRNKHTTGYYRLDRACELARARRYKSRRNSHFSESEWDMVLQKLTTEQWSPEQISNKFREQGVLKISLETIYKRIRKNRQDGGCLYMSLRQANKERRKRYRTNDNRGVLRGKRHISERPEEANNRSEIGHVEADLMHGKYGKDCVLTLVDRKSRKTKVVKLPNKTKRSVTRWLIRMIRKYKIKTITVDNGTEFHGFKYVERCTGVKFFFATPYHSWERGTNENTNGLIRQYLPKWKSMIGLTQRECDKIAHKLNTRPRKCLDWKTPDETHG
jgi:IS30 family transposase